MPIFRRDQVSLFFELTGDPRKPPLVLSNSLGTDLSMWTPQVASFAEHFSLLRYDARGHGRSSVPKGPYSIEQLGQDVLSLLGALGISRVHFCGLSMGGMVGQWLAVHAPEQIDRLVLCNTAASIGTPEGWNTRIETVRAHGMVTIVPSVLERWYTARFRSGHPEVVASTAAVLEGCDPEGYVASCAAVRDMDQRDAIHQITAPTLVVFGAEDQVTPPEAAQVLAERIPHTHLLSLPAAHLSNVECSQQFTQAVRSFLLDEHDPEVFDGR